MKKLIDLLIFYVTYKCNSRCKTCFYWRNLNSEKKELSLEEIKKISEHLGSFKTLLLGGGEPTLRKEVVDIAELLYKKNNVHDISMPTNCLDPNRVVQVVTGLLEKCPNAIINIGLSLDGVGEVHDKIRGVKGNFEKVVEAERRLRIHGSKHKNLIIKILTTITEENYENLPSLMKFVRENMKVRYHYFEPIRGDPKDKNQRGITYEQLKALNKKVLKNYTYYYKDKIRMIYDLYNIRRSQENAEQFFKEGTMKLKCIAGTNAAVIEANGDVSLCELLEKVGNLKDVNYNFKEVWFSKKAEEQRRFIKDKRCACTHCVFLEKSNLSKIVEAIRWR